MPFCFLSSPSQTLRLTPLTRALRAARAHDAVLRMYPDLPLRFIKIHGDILVSYALCVNNFNHLIISYEMVIGKCAPCDEQCVAMIVSCDV